MHINKEKNQRGLAMKALFGIGLLYSVVVPFIVLYITQNESYVWMSLLVGVFITITSRFNELVEFSLGPLKAKMKEKIAQTEATLEQLRKVGVSTSGAILTSIMAENFSGGTTFRRRKELHDKIIKMLGGIGANEKEIQEAESDWIKGISVIYYREITWRVKLQKNINTINSAAPEENKAAGNELDLLLDFKNWLVPSPDKITEILSKNSIDIEKVNILLKDYEWFLNKNEIRNVDILTKE
jgi:hypothetical protein